MCENDVERERERERERALSVLTIHDEIYDDEIRQITRYVN